MKTFLLSTLLLLALSAPLQAQVAKGLKALETKDYPTAKAAFETALITDPNDAAAHFGLSRYYGLPATGEKDNEKALASLEAAEAAFQKADDKEKARLDKSGVNKVNLTERRDRIESSFLESAKEINTIASYDAFLQRFPNSTVARPATNYRNDLAYKAAEAAATEAAWNDFITRYPEAEVLPQAITQRNQVAAAAALKTNTVNAYSAFIKNYPDAPQTPQMQQRLNAVAFEEVKTANTIAAYEQYIRDYPDSIFIAQARERLAYLKGGVSDE